MRSVAKVSNELVYALSTRGELNLKEFYQILNSIMLPVDHDYADIIINPREQVVRALDGLGYCLFDYNLGKVYVCPPGLIRLPSFGLPKALLVGARIPRTVENLKKAVKDEGESALISIRSQAPIYSEIPPTIYIEADTTETLQRISDACGMSSSLGFPASSMLATLSDSLEKVKSEMAFVPHNKEVQGLKFYNVEKMVFMSSDPSGQSCLTDYKDELTNRHTHWYWNGTEAAAIERTWGIFAALSDNNKRVILYDRHNQLIAVPALTPLPPLLARSLYLSSGIPPSVARIPDQGIADVPLGYMMYIYSGVHESLASCVSNKLGQELIFQELGTEPGGR